MKQKVEGCKANIRGQMRNIRRVKLSSGGGKLKGKKGLSDPMGFK